VPEFVLSRLATNDLADIWSYIASDNIDAADRFVTEVEETCLRLAVNPRLGHSRKDLTLTKVRFWPVGSYLVIYKDILPLQIVRILSGYRDVAALLNS
jgi:plasmid stabilization system protein ParE